MSNKSALIVALLLRYTGVICVVVAIGFAAGGIAALAAAGVALIFEGVSAEREVAP